MNTLEKINSFAKLDEGWDYGSGGPITIEACAKALELAKPVVDAKHSCDVFPSSDRGILLCIYFDAFTVEIYIFKDGETTVEIDDWEN